MSTFSQPQQQIASATVSLPRANGTVNPPVAHPAEVVPLPQGQREGEGANSGGFMAKFQVHFPRSGNDNSDRRIISRTHTDAEGWGWRLVLHPWGHDARGCYSAFLELANPQSLPMGFSRYVRLEFALHPWDAAYQAESLKTDFLLHRFNIQATDFGYTRAFEHDVIMAQRNKYIDPQGFVRMSVKILDVKEAFFRVATDADLARSITGCQGQGNAWGGDFADWSTCLPAKSFKHDQLLYVIQKVAELTGVPLVSCRPWLCMPHFHSGGAIRPVAALLPQHFPMTVSEALGDRSQYHIYLEEVNSLPEVWERRRSTVGDIPPDVAGELLLSGRAYAQLPSEVFLVFLKIDKRILSTYVNNGRNLGTNEDAPHPADSGEAQFVFIGKAMAHKSDRSSELVPIARNLARLPESVILEVFEQLGQEEVRPVDGESTVEQAGLQHGAVLLFRGAQGSVLAPPPPSNSSCPAPSDSVVNTHFNNLNAAAASSSAAPAPSVSQGYRPSTSGAGSRGGVAATSRRVSRSPAGLSSVPAITAVPPPMTPILPAPTPTSAAVSSWSASASAAAVVAAAAAAAAAAANGAAGRLVAPLAHPTPPVHSTKLSEIRSAIDPATTRSLMLLPAVSSPCGGKNGVAVGAPGWEGRSSKMADAGAGDVGMAVARGMAALSAQHQQRREALDNVTQSASKPKHAFDNNGYHQANQENVKGHGSPEEEQATNAARKAAASTSASAELSRARQDSVTSGAITTTITSNSCKGNSDSSSLPLSPLADESRVARDAAEATRHWTVSITEALRAGTPASPVPGTAKAVTAFVDPPAIDANGAGAVASAGAGSGSTEPAEIDAGGDTMLQGTRHPAISAASTAVAPSEGNTTTAPHKGAASGENTESEQMMSLDVNDNGFGNSSTDEVREGSTPLNQQERQQVSNQQQQQQQQPKAQQPGRFERFDQFTRSEHPSEERPEQPSISEVKCEQPPENERFGERDVERQASASKKTRHPILDNPTTTSVPLQQQHPAPCSRVTRARAGRMASPQSESQQNLIPVATTRVAVQHRTSRKGSEAGETRKTRYSTRAAFRGKGANSAGSGAGIENGSSSGSGSRADSCSSSGSGPRLGSGSSFGFSTDSYKGSGNPMQQGNGSTVHSLVIEALRSRMNPHGVNGDGECDVGGTTRNGGSKAKSSDRVSLKRAADSRWIEGEQQQQQKYARKSTSNQPAPEGEGEFFVGLDAMAMLNQIHQVEGCNMDKVLEVMKSAESIQIAKAIQSASGDDWRAKQVERLLALREKSAYPAAAAAAAAAVEAAFTSTGGSRS